LPITEGTTAGQGVVNISVGGVATELFSAANPALAAATNALPCL